MTRPLKIALAVLGLAVALLAVLVLLEMRAPALPAVPADTPAAPSAQVARGAYLAQAGNCMACHTARGGQPYAGGHGVATPFGTVFASNLTPDPATGLGHWSAEAFRRALHEGRSRDGHLLYPAFPYDHTTRLSDADTDALYAFLRSLPPVAQATPPHTLRFPYSTQAALAVWRLLFFDAGRFEPDPQRSAAWNQGAYVATVAHCAACHTTRNAWGGPATVWGGNRMPDGRWWAPSLRDPREAGVQHWSEDQIVALLQGGQTADASVLGPMAEVVFHGTQYLHSDDLTALAGFLRTLPTDSRPTPPFEPADPAQRALGERLYGQQCAACHGDAGQGAAGAYPALAGNRVVQMDSPVNTLQAILSGGFAPATARHPQPYGMPPFRTLLGDAEVAAVASFIRQSWGNQAAAVAPLDVQRVR